MEYWYSIVIGTVAFLYIQMFLWNARNMVEAGIEPARFSKQGILSPPPLTTPASHRLILEPYSLNLFL